MCSQWQDISTAPKDGTAILAAHPDRGYVSVAVFKGSEWECLDFTGAPLGNGFYPTHWKPLDVPPSTHGEG